MQLHQVAFACIPTACFNDIETRKLAMEFGCSFIIGFGSGFRRIKVA